MPSKFRREEINQEKAKQVQLCKAINEQLASLVAKTDDGNGYRPMVCCICDRFLTHRIGKDTIPAEWLEQDRAENLRAPTDPNAFNFIDGQRREDYRYTGNGSTSSIRELLLSKRCTYFTAKSKAGPPIKNHKNPEARFTCCSECKVAMSHSTMPKKAIANNYAPGKAPECLACLNMVELSYLTPIKKTGYIVCYTGGRHLALKGTLMFCKAIPEDIAEGILRLEKLVLENKVVILLSGKMTPSQIKAARKHNQFRVGKVMAAMEWLLENNSTWRNSVDIEALKEKVDKTKPFFVDESEGIGDSDPGSAAHQKETEHFVHAYFPDRFTSSNGGEQNKKVYDMFASMAKHDQHSSESNTGITFMHEIDRMIVRDYEGDNLVESSLLQFPYGVCGRTAQRKTARKEFTDAISIEEFCLHMIDLAEPMFQLPMFILTLFNSWLRVKLVRRAFLKVKSLENVDITKQTFTSEEIKFAFSQIEKKHNIRNEKLRKLIRNVYFVAESPPHSKGAALKFRKWVEGYAIVKGNPSFFITITPDDLNSFLVHVYIGKWEEFCEKSTQSNFDIGAHCNSLRIKFPGAAALMYDDLRHIICEQILGWDLCANCPTEKGGVVGKPYCVCISTEEQNRATLHMHILVWVEGVQKKISQLQTSQRKVSKELCTLVESVASSDILGAFPNRQLQRRLEHSCVGGADNKPELCKGRVNVVSKQKLRNLRTRAGYKHHCGIIATCETCKRSWTNEQLYTYAIRDELRKFGIRIEDDYTLSKRERAKLCAELMKAQVPGAPPIFALLRNYVYNVHLEKHTCSCTKLGRRANSTGFTKRTAFIECRYRHPAFYSIASVIARELAKDTDWFSWSGARRSFRHLKFIARRHQFDTMANTHLRAISESNLACNSNFKMILEGSVAVYSIKYPLKCTQEQDSEDVKKTCETFEKLFGGKPSCSQRKANPNGTTDSKTSSYESECESESESTTSNEQSQQTENASNVMEQTKKEFMSAFLRACFVAESSDTITPNLAAHIMRNGGERFYFSGDTTSVYLYQMTRILSCHQAETVLEWSKQSATRVSYMQQPLHYLCRSKHLEHLSLYDFFTQYFLVEKPAKQDRKRRKMGYKGERFYKFEDTESFKHPNKNTHVMCKRGHPCVGVIDYHLFHDMADHGCDYLDPETTATPVAEHNARLALMLFMPFRDESDLQTYNSCVSKMREYKYKLKPSERQILTNIQNYVGNYVRNERQPDELEKDTVTFEEYLNRRKDACVDDDSDNDSFADDEDEHEDLKDATLFDVLSTRKHENDDTPQHFELPIKRRLGMAFTPQTPPTMHERPSDFVSFLPTESTGNEPDKTEANEPDEPNKERDYWKDKRHFFRVSIRETSRTTVKTSAHSDIDVPQPKGHWQDIVQWSNSLGFDKEQQIAFETIVASTVISLHKKHCTTLDDCGLTAQEEEQFQNNFEQLRRLGRIRTKQGPNVVGARKEDQLVLLLHGPGGAGKTTVLEAVQQYIEKYYIFADIPFDKKNSIQMTAMTGVAATILGGQTTHSVLHMNRGSVHCTQTDRDNFENTSILVVDECSFLTNRDIKMMNNLLNLYCDAERSALFGNLTIIFSGDFRQIPPIKKQSPYEEENNLYMEFLNCYIELHGMYRYKSDPEFGVFLRDLRNGKIDKAYIDKINRTCMVSETRRIPHDATYACAKNDERSTVNISTFHNVAKAHKESTLVILSGNLAETTKSGNGKGTRRSLKQRCNEKQKKFVWRNFQEEDVKTNGNIKRIDPALRLYYNCPLMLTLNKDLSSGLSNGCRFRLKKVRLKPKAKQRFVYLSESVKVPAYEANDVDHIVGEHIGGRFDKQTFKLKPEDIKFDLRTTCFKKHSSVGMSATQFPCVRNTATTGHKLQGLKLYRMVVLSWCYHRNWAYTVLSRVVSLDGLYLKQPLSTNDSDWKLPDSLSSFLEFLKELQPRA